MLYLQQRQTVQSGTSEAQTFFIACTHMALADYEMSQIAAGYNFCQQGHVPHCHLANTHIAERHSYAQCATP